MGDQEDDQQQQRSRQRPSPRRPPPPSGDQGRQPSDQSDQHFIVRQVMPEGKSRPKGVEGVFLHQRAQNGSPQHKKHHCQKSQALRAPLPAQGFQACPNGEQERQENRNDMSDDDHGGHRVLEADHNRAVSRQGDLLSRQRDHHPVFQFPGAGLLRQNPGQPVVLNLHGKSDERIFGFKAAEDQGRLHPGIDSVDADRTVRGRIVSSGETVGDSFPGHRCGSPKGVGRSRHALINQQEQGDKNGDDPQHGFFHISPPVCFEDGMIIIRKIIRVCNPRDSE